MAIIRRRACIAVCVLLAACQHALNDKQNISEVYVKDFQSTDIASCKPSDVDLNNHEAKQFFLKANKVSYQVIHDHYNVAPCFIEGVLNNDGMICQWKIQASAIGSMTCDGKVRYFACDQCEGLFN